MGSNWSALDLSSLYSASVRVTLPFFTFTSCAMAPVPRMRAAVRIASFFIFFIFLCGGRKGLKGWEWL